MNRQAPTVLSVASITAIFVVLFPLSTIAQTFPVGSQSPFPNFANFQLCDITSFESQSTGYCVNSISGAITSWGSNPDLNIPEGSFYTVESIKNDVNGSAQGGCAIRQTTFEVVCWGNDELVNNLPNGLTAFRIGVGLYFACALSFDPSLINTGDLVLKDPNGQQAFYDSVSMVCWGQEYTEVSGNSNKNFPMPVNNGSNPPVDLLASYKYTCVVSLNGLYNCGGQVNAEFSADGDVYQFVDNTTQVSVFAVNRDRFCYVETDGVTKACRGRLCTLDPAICDISQIPGGVSVDNNIALAISFNGACMIDTVNELACFGMPAFNPAPNITKWREIYATENSPDNYCGIALRDGTVECFGTESDNQFPQPPIHAYNVNCTQTTVAGATLLELVDTSTNPYICIENGQSSVNRMEWDISGVCSCYPRTVNNLFSYDRNQGTCGVAPYRFVLEPTNGVDPNDCRKQ